MSDYDEFAKRMGSFDMELSLDDIGEGNTEDDTLTHHGIKGMKWGVRRYQPYTTPGRGRFLGKTKPKKPPINTKGLSMRDANAKRRLMTSTTKGKKTIDVNPTAKAKLDKLNAKQKAQTSATKEKRVSKKAARKNEMDSMTDVELRQRINRLNMEKQYTQLTTKETSKGMKIVENILVNSASQVASKYVVKGIEAGISKSIDSVKKHRG